MSHESMKGNKNAEKWTYEEADKLFQKALELIETREVQYLADLDAILGKSLGCCKYIFTKFGFYNKFNDSINKYKPNRECLWKRSTECREREKIMRKKSYDSTKKYDINFRLRSAISSLLNYHIKNRNAQRTKENSKLSMLSFSIEELKKHLEKKFEKGMSFDNYGDWHIDHIIPCSWFDLSDKEQFNHCWALHNLKPMWGSQNSKKQNKYSENPQLKILI